MFTLENTEGYTQAELDALNAELANMLTEIYSQNAEAIHAAVKAFSDAVAQR